jgi:hypothetical protein
MSEIIQGNWDDLVARHDLHGRRVRIIVLDESAEADDTSLASDGAASATGDAWLKSLRIWADSHKTVGHFVDDSRESIYSGTVDDPR